MRNSITSQFYAFEVVAASVDMHYQGHGAQGKAARNMFDTYATFDVYASSNLDAGAVPVKLSWAEYVVSATPMGQLALFMVLHFAANGNSKVIASVLASDLHGPQRRPEDLQPRGVPGSHHRRGGR